MHTNTCRHTHYIVHSNTYMYTHKPDGCCHLIQQAKPAAELPLIDWPEKNTDYTHIHTLQSDFQHKDTHTWKYIDSLWLFEKLLTLSASDLHVNRSPTHSHNTRTAHSHNSKLPAATNQALLCYNTSSAHTKNHFAHFGMWQQWQFMQKISLVQTKWKPSTC